MKTNILILMAYEGTDVGSYLGNCNGQLLSNIGCVEDLEGYISNIDKADFDFSTVGMDSISWIGTNLK